MLRQTLACLYDHVTPIFWGSPGIGKTAFARNLARQIGGRSYFICLSQREGVEVHGAQVLAGKFDYQGREYTMTELAPPRYVREAVTSKVPIVVVFDELTTARPDVQAPTLSIIGEYVASEIDLPRDNVGIIACANPPDEAAGGWPLPPPMANRLCHMPYKVDPKAWAEQFPSYWGEAPEITRWGQTLPEDDWIQARSLVAAFIHANTDALLRIPKGSEAGQKTADSLPAGRNGPWPSPRTWDYVSRVLAGAKRHGLTEGELHEIVSGLVGSGAAVSFMQYREKMDLPDPRYLIDNPGQFQLPQRNDQTFYLMKGVVTETIHRKKQADAAPNDKSLGKRATDAWLSAWKIMAAIHEHKHGPRDIAVLGAHELAHQDNHPKGAIPPEEVDLFIETLRASGVQWSTQPTGRRKR
jgi:MoxR-like ATPase